MKIQLDSAIHLLHAGSNAVLATQSTNLPGSPYATAVPLVVDEHHRPLLLISALAEHTKNLLADPRSSLSVVEQGPSNVQNAARMTVVGDFERFDAAPERIARYLRYQPDAEHHLQLDFLFFRLRIQRIRFIAGIGKMGWLEASDWSDGGHIAPADESVLLAQSEQHLPPGVTLIGLDAYGVDYLAVGVRRRLSFDQVLTSEEISKRLPALVRSLR